MGWNHQLDIDEDWWIHVHAEFIRRSNRLGIKYPIASMYGIFTCIYHQYQPNVGTYTIHGWYGYEHQTAFIGKVTDGWCTIQCRNNLLGSERGSGHHVSGLSWILLVCAICFHYRCLYTVVSLYKYTYVYSLWRLIIICLALLLHTCLWLLITCACMWVWVKKTFNHQL